MFEQSDLFPALDRDGQRGAILRGLSALLFLGMLLVPLARAAAQPEFSEPDELLASDARAGDQFGHALALESDIALVGAFLDDDACPQDVHCDSGAAYLFERQAGGAWLQIAKLVAAQGAAGDQFGSAVALRGDTALVGAHGDGEKGAYAGAAYVFQRAVDGGWEQIARLTAEDGSAGDWFGYAVALDDGTALVGAFQDDDACSLNVACNSGAAYVFQLTEDGTWVQTAKLTPEDAAAGDWFGSALALEGDTALVGAQGADEACALNTCSYAGAAYVFEQQETGIWRQVARLAASHGGSNHWFGAAVALRDDEALVGSYGDQDGGLGAGAAYLFGRQDDGTWIETARLTATEGVAGDFFGDAVALDESMALIGASGYGEDGLNSGSAYLFARQDDGAWAQLARLTPSTGSAGDRFGSALALDDGIAFVGAPLSDDACPEDWYCNAGAVYVAEASTGVGE